MPRAARRPSRASGSGADADSWRVLVACEAEAIAEASHGFDDAAAELAAQMVDMHVQRVALDVVGKTVDRVLELLAAEHPALVVEQRLQQCLFAARQVDEAAVQDRKSTRLKSRH